MDKLLAQLDAKTIILLLAGFGSNGVWAFKPEEPSIPINQYTAVVTTLTQERADAVTAKEACQDALLKKQSRTGRRK